MNEVLQKSIVGPFYKAHLGFFLVLAFFGLGLIRGTEHITIAKYIADSSFLTVILLVLFSMYHFKLWLFLRHLFQQREYRFIRSLSLLTIPHQFKLLLLPYLTMTTVTWGYGVFVSIFMWQKNQFGLLSVIFIYIASSIILFIFWTMRTFKNPVAESIFSSILPSISHKVAKPYFLWFVLHLFKTRVILYVFSKLLSLSILIGSFEFYAPELYDWRFVGVGVVFAMSANLIIARSYFEFEFIELKYFRSFPKNVISRIAAYITTTLILVLPEIIVTIRRFPSDLNISLVIQIIVYAIMIVLFYMHWALLKNGDSEKLGKACFFLTLAQVYIVLFSIPLYFPILLILAFLVVVQLRHDRFEVQTINK